MADPTPRTLCLIQGHPDPDGGHLNNALADAYAEGAAEAGHTVLRISIAEMDIPYLRNAHDFASDPPPDVKAAQDKILEADHLVVFFPLWLGGMPAMLRAFFEHVARAGFALARSEHGWPKGQLAGRSARVVVTMGMPSQAYRWFFGAQGVRGFERGVLALSGFKPVRETLLGLVDAVDDAGKARWMARMRRLGRHAG